MTRILLGVAALSLVGANIRTDKISLPKGPQPMQVAAQIDKEGNLLIRQTTTAYVPETRQRIVQKDGRNVTETFTTYVAVYRTVEYRVKSKGFQVRGLDGKAVDRNTLARRLARETPMLLSADGKPVDPFYLQVLKAGTLVLVLPRTEGTPVLLPEPAVPPQKIPKNADKGTDRPKDQG